MDGAIEARHGKWHYQRATQSDGLPRDERLPVWKFRRREASLGGVTGARFATREIPIRQRSGSAGHPLPALDRRLYRRTSRKFVHRDGDLVNYLLSI